MLGIIIVKRCKGKCEASDRTRVGMTQEREREPQNENNTTVSSCYLIELKGKKHTL